MAKTEAEMFAEVLAETRKDFQPTVQSSGSQPVALGGPSAAPDFGGFLSDDPWEDAADQYLRGIQRPAADPMQRKHADDYGVDIAAQVADTYATLYRSLVLGGFMSLDTYRRLKRVNALTMNSPELTAALAGAMESADSAGMPWEDYLAHRSEGLTEADMAPMRPRRVLSDPAELRKAVRETFKNEFGRAPNAKELERYTKVISAWDSQRASTAVDAQVAAAAGEDASDIVTVDPQARLEEDLHAEGEAVAHRARGAFERFRQLVGG